MKALNNHKAIILYGPPGSGKGTQAELLANKLDFVHFDTGRYLRDFLHNSKYKNDKIVQYERKLNDSGKLNSPEWVLKIVSDKAKKINKLSKGVIFSGSPRTVFEAFGDKAHKGLMSVLERIYSKDNIHVFYIDISEKETIKRNTHRLVCSICRMPVLYESLPRNCSIKVCPFCGGKFVYRFDDVDEVIKTRLNEYSDRTKPIIEKLKKGGYRVIKIDGRPMPYKIHLKIASLIK